MIEILPALEGLISSAKAMASFDAFRKGRKGDARALIEELKANSRLCFRVIDDGVAPEERMESIEQRSDERSIVIEATTAQVFAAISDPARLAWWWGPTGFRTTTIGRLRAGPVSVTPRLS